MILNQYYYKVILPNNNELYFTGIEDDGTLKGLTVDKDEIMKNRVMSFGSGFFISDKGEILTNRHVVSPDIEISDVKGGIKNLLSGLNQYFNNAESEIQSEYQTLQQQIDQNYEIDAFGNFNENTTANEPLREQQEQLKQTYQQIESYKSEIAAMDVSDIKFSTESELGVAYHDTFVTSTKDFKACVIIKKSEDSEADLALIQLNDKKIPDNAHVFTFAGDVSDEQDSFTYKLTHLFSSNDNDETKLKIEQPLFMIGYNQGIELANTQQGIKAQITSGNVTQEPDENRVMYSISALQGSSGSPILNEYGQVVAINFAGLLNTQNFNFGIPLNQIKKFLKG